MYPNYTILEQQQWWPSLPESNPSFSGDPPPESHGVACTTSGGFMPTPNPRSPTRLPNYSPPITARLGDAPRATPAGLIAWEAVRRHPARRFSWFISRYLLCVLFHQPHSFLQRTLLQNASLTLLSYL